MAERKFTTCIKGLEKLIEKDIPKGAIILITGAPGALKSGLVFNLLSNYLRGKGESGLYVTLEQPVDSLLSNMESLGLRKADELKTIDVSTIRENIEMERTFSATKIIEELLNRYKQKKLSCFVLDSLSAFLSFGLWQSTRNELYYFFSRLRKEGLTSFILCEVPFFEKIVEYSPEYFLGDGIIELGVHEISGKISRYIRVIKMRGTAHKMGKYRLVVGKNGLEILGSL